MFDFTVDFGSFRTTTITLVPVTQRGREFIAARLGLGGKFADIFTSAEIFKSQGQDFLDAADAAGVTFG